MSNPSARSFVLAWIALGCADAPQVQLRIRSGVFDDPFAAATHVTIALEQDQRSLTEERYPVALSTASLGAVPFGEGFQFRVEALAEGLAGDLLLARGRSFPFDFAETMDELDVAVLVGSLGRFSRPTTETLSAIPVAALPTASGAIVATRDGRLIRFVMHAEAGQEFVILREDPSLTNSAWSTTGDEQFLVALGPSGLVAFDHSGQRVAAMPPASLNGQIVGVAMVPLPRLPALALVGGAASDESAERGDVTVITVGVGGFESQPLPALPTPRRNARAATVEVEAVGGSSETRIVAVGGVNSGAPVKGIAVADIEGRQAPRELAVPSLADNPTVAAISTGAVVIAGGIDGTGQASGDLALIQVQANLVAVLSPPPPLFQARVGAAVVPVTDGVVILVGGVGSDATPLETAELVDVSLGVLPGNVVPTGSLPAPSAEPVAIRLGDGTIAVFDANGVASYFPPR